MIVHFTHKTFNLETNEGSFSRTFPLPGAWLAFQMPKASEMVI